MNGLESLKIALPHATSHSSLYKWELITRSGKHCRWSACTAVKVAGTTLLSDKVPVPLEQKIHAGEKPVTAVLQLVYGGKRQGNQKKPQTVGNALVTAEWEESSTDSWPGNLTDDGALRKKRVDLRDLAKLMVGTLMDSYYSGLLEVKEVEDEA